MKKFMNIIKIILGIIIAIVLLLVGGFVYLDNWHVTEIDQEISSDQEYTLRLQCIGGVPWPYGPVDVRLILEKDGKIIKKEEFVVYTDGINEYSWDVTWGDEEIVVMVSGKLDVKVTMDYEGNESLIEMEK